MVFQPVIVLMITNHFRSSRASSTSATWKPTSSGNATTPTTGSAATAASMRISGSSVPGCQITLSMPKNWTVEDWESAFIIWTFVNVIKLSFSTKCCKQNKIVLKPKTVRVINHVIHKQKTKPEKWFKDC